MLMKFTPGSKESVKSIKKVFCTFFSFCFDKSSNKEYRRLRRLKKAVTKKNNWNVFAIKRKTTFAKMIFHFLLKSNIILYSKRKSISQTVTKIFL